MKNLILNHKDKNRKVNKVNLIKKAALALLIALILAFYFLCFHFVFK